MMMMTPHQTIRLDSNNQCNTDRLNENQIDQHEQHSTADLNKKHLTRNLLSKSDKNMPATFGYQAKNVQDWTVEDVAEWLNFNNFGSYVDLFCDQHKIDGQVLITLDADDLRSEPLKLTILGDIKRFCLAFEQLKSSMNKNMNSKFQSNCNVLKQSHTTSHHSTQQNLNHVNHDQRAVPTNLCDPKSSSGESRCSSNGFNQQDTSNDVEDPYTDEEVERIRQDKGFDNAAITNNNVDLSSSSRSSSSSSMTSDSSSFESRYEDENMSQSLINPSKSNEIQNHRPLRIISQTITQQELAHLVSSTHSNHSYHQTMVNTPIAVNSSEELLRPSQQKNPGVYYKEQRYRSHHHRHHHHRRHHHNRKEFKPEAWKAIVALIYIFASTWVTAIVMVIVHDRVPDMDTYPPLPDLILDNLPLIPWAFSMAETCGLILFIIWALILIFHKHRFILIRRMFSLFGSVFLIRCFTMLITSLSVPGRHLQCKARPYGTWSERLYQAYIIWQGGGMAIQGVRTCGDYMFSGHTVVLTMLNFFITEYTPPGLYLIHTMSWVLNLFGVFFILAAHEHYSIDVFIAFYISTRLFLYYHTLANNRALYQSDRRRTRVWFPLFYFFESGVPGIVPNEYEIPFRNTKDRLFKYLSSKIRRIAWIRLILDDVWQLDGYKTNDAGVPDGGYVKIKNQ